MARNAPGLPPRELERMTPEETNLVRREVLAMVKAESDERLEYVKALVKSSGARLLI